MADIAACTDIGADTDTAASVAATAEGFTPVMAE
jgi:hypothetical protein